jgi:ABC-type phosphate/phosphonate transport system substrate-binding protein
MLTRCAAAFLIFCFVLGVASASAENPIRVGLVFDGLTPEERAPLPQYLTKAMGRTVIVTAPDQYSETVAQLGPTGKRLL